jgi:thymidine kinase
VRSIEISTHDDVSSTPAFVTDDLTSIDTADYNVFAIDEGQFFHDISNFADALANAGKTVIVAALDLDYRREPFGQVPLLMAKAEKVDKLTAICACGAEASFSKRRRPNSGGVGGNEKYTAVCRHCYFV